MEETRKSVTVEKPNKKANAEEENEMKEYTRKCYKKGTRYPSPPLTTLTLKIIFTLKKTVSGKNWNGGEHT